MLSIYDGAISEAQLLHGREAGNSHPTSDALYFSTLRKTKGRPVQRSFRMPSLESVVSGMIGNEDTYISQSSFWSCGRKTVHFKQTRAAWVDLDLYNIDKKVDAATIAQILRHAVDLGIPAPTAVIASGRGCYLKWMFHTPVTQQQLPVWQTLQAVLTAAFSSLAADASARDASRVLRLLQTRNSKSGALVELIDGCGVLYDFLEVCRSVEALQVDLLVEAKNKPSSSRSQKLARKTTALSQPLLHASARGDVQALNLFAELHQPIMLDKLSARSLNWGRFCDLRNLYEQRGGIPVGERDTTMFWMLNFLSHSNVIHASNWEREIGELQQAFPSPESFSPAQDGSMSSLLHRVRDHENGVKRTWKGVPVSALYRPGNQFLIKAFAIEPEEMKSLSTIISPEEKQARRDTAVEGRSERRAQRNQWRDEVRHAFEGQKAHLAQLAQTSAAADAATKEAVVVVGVGAAGATGVKAARAAQVGQVNLKALATYLGVERTRVNRYWGRLQAEHAQSILTAQALPRAQGKKDKALAGISPLETVRLAKLATFKAIEAKEAQLRLVFERKKLAMQNSWARRKLAGLIEPMPVTSMDNEDNKMAVNSTKLSKKMALLNAALSVGQDTLPGEPVVLAAPGAAAIDTVLAMALVPEEPSSIESDAQRLDDSPTVVLQTISEHLPEPGMATSMQEKEVSEVVKVSEVGEVGKVREEGGVLNETLTRSAISAVEAEAEIEADLSNEGYDAFFDAQQSYEWIDAKLPNASRDGLEVNPPAALSEPMSEPMNEPVIEPLTAQLTAPAKVEHQTVVSSTPKGSVPVAAQSSQSQTSGTALKMSAAERLRASRIAPTKVENQAAVISTPQSPVPVSVQSSQTQTSGTVLKMSAAERLQATMRQASQSKASRFSAEVQTPLQRIATAVPPIAVRPTAAPSISPDATNFVSSLPTPVIVAVNDPVTTQVASQMTTATKPLLATVLQVDQKADVADVTPDITVVTPAPVRPVPVMPMPVLVPAASAPLIDASSGVSADRTRAAPLTASERLRMVAERVSKLPPLQRESKSSTERVALVEGAAGAPRSYPTEAMWPSHDIPPGSRYSAVEWQAARQDALLNRFEVLEVQSAKKSYLLQIAIPEQTTSRALVNGKLVTTICDVVNADVKLAGINSLMRQFYSNCLLVSMDSFPEFPGAVEADFINNSVRFRVIRPRTDYLDSNQAYRVGAAMHMQLNPEESYLHDDENSNEFEESQISAPSA